MVDGVLPYQPTGPPVAFTVFTRWSAVLLKNKIGIYSMFDNG